MFGERGIEICKRCECYVFKYVFFFEIKRFFLFVFLFMDDWKRRKNFILSVKYCYNYYNSVELFLNNCCNCMELNLF